MTSRNLSSWVGLRAWTRGGCAGASASASADIVPGIRVAMGFIALVPAGRLDDVIGRRLLFLVGLAMFSGFSVLQGLGAGMINTQTFGLILLSVVTLALMPAVFGALVAMCQFAAGVTLGMVSALLFFDGLHLYPLLFFRAVDSRHAGLDRIDHVELAIRRALRPRRAGVCNRVPCARGRRARYGDRILRGSLDRVFPCSLGFAICNPDYVYPCA